MCVRTKIHTQTIFVHIHKYDINKLKNVLWFISGKNICRTCWHELKKLTLNRMIFLCYLLYLKVLYLIGKKKADICAALPPTSMPIQ